MHRVVPWVYVSYHAAVVYHISCRAEENPRHMHQFAEGEIGKQDADKEKVYVKNNADSLRDDRVEADESHCQFLNTDKSDLRKVTHHDAGDGNAQNKEKRKVVGSKRDVVHLGDSHSSYKKIGHRNQKDYISHIEQWNSYLHKTIETFDDMNGQRHFNREKPEMPDEYYKERPVERQSCKPEPFV